MISAIIAWICLIWYLAVLLVSALGVYRIRKSHRSVRNQPQCLARSAEHDLPHITIIRPVKGLEPYLQECLEATFRQSYPSSRLSIHFCIESRQDSAYPLLLSLQHDHPQHDVHIFVEAEDPVLSGANGSSDNLGPNPKIRNMSRAYREARGDIIWIVDCNVWVGHHAAALMVDLLCGYAASITDMKSPRPSGHGRTAIRKYKFVHQLPLVVNVATPPLSDTNCNMKTTVGNRVGRRGSRNVNSMGGRLEQMFLSTAHAKFYTAINTVAVAPCIVGKSNMFRKSHLDALTTAVATTGARSTANIPTAQQGQSGIDHFSSNICEDHLIGDLLWRSPVPPSVQSQAVLEGPLNSKFETLIHDASQSSLRQQPQDRPEDCPIPDTSITWGHHALLPPSPENLAIQPMQDFSLSDYISRRIRWLRVRKFTVTLATLVEPGTESFLCSAYGAYSFTYFIKSHIVHSSALSTPFSSDSRIPHALLVWPFVLFWLCSVFLWMSIDRHVYRLLNNTDSRDPNHIYGNDFSHPNFITLTNTSSNDPSERNCTKGENVNHAGHKDKDCKAWICTWLLREGLALPIWIWACWGGASVYWRGRRFRVRTDMRVYEIMAENDKSTKHLKET